MEFAAQPLEIIYSATALKELDKIWEWNADYHDSADHANTYIDFLKSEIRSLSAEPQKGKGVETNPKLRYLLMKWSTQGYGHIAVYRISETAVRIVHVFHSSQDWENKVKSRRAPNT